MLLLCYIFLSLMAGIGGGGVLVGVEVERSLKPYILYCSVRPAILSSKQRQSFCYSLVSQI